MSRIDQRGAHLELGAAVKRLRQSQSGAFGLPARLFAFDRMPPRRVASAELPFPRRPRSKNPGCEPLKLEHHSMQTLQKGIVQFSCNAVALVGCLPGE